MCSKHVEAWNKLIVKQKFCASSWLITEINILWCTVSKTSKLCTLFMIWLTSSLIYISSICFWIQTCFNFQNLTVPGGNNVHKFVSVGTSVCFILSIAETILVQFEMNFPAEIILRGGTSYLNNGGGQFALRPGHRLFLLRPILVFLNS